MNTLKYIKTGLVTGLVSLITVFTGGFIYATVSPIASLNEGISSAKWNIVATNYTIPAGYVGAFYLSTCPSGWVAADGANSAPDLRGQFIRGLNNFGGSAGTRSDGKQDPDTRTLGSSQLDSMQNITGTFAAASYWAPVLSGPFNSATIQYVYNDAGRAGGSLSRYNYLFDSSMSVKTSTETRARNVALIYCMKL